MCILYTFIKMKFASCIVLLLVLLVNLSNSLKCAPDACHVVRCAGATCGPGEVLGKGGYCLCCDVCRKIVGLNEYCGSGNPIGGVISDTVTCADGLICREDKCQET